MKKLTEFYGNGRRWCIADDGSASFPRVTLYEVHDGRMTQCITAESEADLVSLLGKLEAQARCWMLTHSALGGE